MKSFLSSQYEANFDDSVSRAILLKYHFYVLLLFNFVFFGMDQSW